MVSAMTISQLPAAGRRTRSIATHIRTELARNNMRQADLLPHLPFAGPQLSQRMNGHVDWTIGDLAAVADALNVSISYLIGERDESDRGSSFGCSTRNRRRSDRVGWVAPLLRPDFARAA